MVPKLRKRLWYQRYLDRNIVANGSYEIFLQRSYSDLHGRRYVDPNGKNAYSSSRAARKSWNSHSRRCGSHDSESVSSSFSDSEFRSLEIKSEPKDVEYFPNKSHPVVEVSVRKSQGQGQSRMLMREWLEVNADCGCMSGLKWLDKDRGLVQIAWKHGSRSGWNRSDVEVFESWALHTGKLNPNKSDCKRWKANFRCALNSLADVVEIKDRCDTRCRNPYKVYCLLPPEKTSPKHSKSRRAKFNGSTDEDFSSVFECAVIKEENQEDDSCCSIKANTCSDDRLDPCKFDCNSVALYISNNSNTNRLKSCVDDDVASKNVKEHRLNHPSLHLPNAVDIPTTAVECRTQSHRLAPSSVDGSSQHNDHNYAYINEHLLSQEIDLLNCHDLVSTINEEFAKFCSTNNIDMGLWNVDDDCSVNEKCLSEDPLELPTCLD